MSELLWVTVPGGTSKYGEEHDVVVRVLIAPRLVGHSLKSEGMEEWPPSELVDMNNRNQKVKVDFSQTEDGEIQTVEMTPHIQAEPGLWKTFFGPNTVVNPPSRREASAPEVAVDSTSTKAKDIIETFCGAAEKEISTLDSFIEAELKKRWSGEELQNSTQPAVNGGESNCQPPDFHGTLALLREHPAVLRALGLIIELRIPRSNLSGVNAEGIVRVRWPDAPAFLPTIVSPWTKYVQGFLPGSVTNRDTNIHAGMVTLNERQEGESWEVVTVEVDNSVKKLRDAARAIDATTERDDPHSFMLPALRTAGMMLVRRGRQNDFKMRRRAADANAHRDSMNEAILTADDLVLGYRIDVKEYGRDWFSLHQREATYKVSNEDGNKVTIGGGTIREEGHVKAHAAIRDESGNVYTDEVVACWRGYSLSVPLPRFDPSVDDIRPLHCPDMPFQFEMSYAVPKRTLPRLRFSHTYQLRARVADIAGGGLELSDTAANRCLTEPETYRRYEPVLPPDLVLPEGLEPKKLGLGESIAHLVIRSDADTDVPEFQATARRLLVAPQTPLTMAEQHGAIDGMSPDQIRDLVKQALKYANQLSPTNPNEVLVPDVAAEGVCVFPRQEPGGLNLAGTAQGWGERWPDFRSMEIILKERTADDSNILEWEQADIENPSIRARLIVRLAKAEELTLELSSFLRGNFLDHLAINVESLPENSKKAAILGRHPMVNPARAVTLTHAVRRPLQSPQGTFVAERQDGMNYAVLIPKANPLLGIDPKSTAKLEIHASWEEPTHDGNKRFVENAPVQTILINRSDKSLQDMIRHEFGDTRHRKITYTLTAVSRFRSFFDDDDENAFTTKTNISVSIPSSARPAPPLIMSTRPAFVWEDYPEEGQQFMLKRLRQGGRLRIELKGSWYETGAGEQLVVLVSKDNNPPDKVKSFITQVGRDPIHSTLISGSAWLTAADFSGKSGESFEIYLKEVDTHVMAVPYQPWFHDGRWFVDIAIPRMAKEAYCPFVQLAVARYQPNTLEELEPVSSVVMTEMVQLFPDRTLYVRRNGNELFVKLNGVAPEHRANYFRWKVFWEKFQSPPGIEAHKVDLTALEANIDGIPAWVPINSNVIFGDSSLNREIRQEIPEVNEPLRIRIQEVESISRHDAGGGDGRAFEERTVYSDVVDLPKT
ncbi:hypothetical protein [Bacillus sp. B15-48]|uniref:hypothetical protein n=1 Tax=Bacillus sp. B15-48 TaxID=1548601 RepID=UPI00193FDDCB|nr:hypothetical protein [Bacillus sp. B15-48]MBM4764825.1 hypothetical protein [Bacillus sp. B15-48]